MSGAGFMADVSGLPEAQREAAKRERALLDACRAYARADAALQAAWAAHEGGRDDDAWTGTFAGVHSAGGERAGALEAMAKAAIAAYGPPPPEAAPPLADAELAALAAGKAFAEAAAGYEAAKAAAREAWRREGKDTPAMREAWEAEWRAWAARRDAARETGLRLLRAYCEVEGGD